MAKDNAASDISRSAAGGLCKVIVIVTMVQGPRTMLRHPFTSAISHPTALKSRLPRLVAMRSSVCTVCSDIGRSAARRSALMTLVSVVQVVIVTMVQAFRQQLHVKYLQPLRHCKTPEQLKKCALAWSMSDCGMGLVDSDAAVKALEDTSPSCLQRLSGPPFPLPTAGSSFSSPMGTSLLLTAPPFCQPPAPPRRELPTTTWCNAHTVPTSSEAESALSAEITLSLQQTLTSVQQQQASVYSLARESSQPISSPEELLSRLNSGHLDSLSSSGLGFTCDRQKDNSLCEGCIHITDDAVNSLPTV